jgi:hypothetical protein
MSEKRKRKTNIALRAPVVTTSPEIQLAGHLTGDLACQSPADLVLPWLHLQPSRPVTTTSIPLSLSLTGSPPVVHGGSRFGGSFGMGGLVMNPYIGVRAPDSRVLSGGAPALGWWGFQI